MEIDFSWTNRRPPPPVLESELRINNGVPEVFLEWHFTHEFPCNEDFVNRYEIYGQQAPRLSDRNNGWERIAELEGFGCPMNFTISDVQMGSTYFYTIRVIDDNNVAGEFSPVVTVTLIDDSTPPLNPPTAPSPPTESFGPHRIPEGQANQPDSTPPLNPPTAPAPPTESFGPHRIPEGQANQPDSTPPLNPPTAPAPPTESFGPHRIPEGQANQPETTYPAASAETSGPQHISETTYPAASAETSGPQHRCPFQAPYCVSDLLTSLLQGMDAAHQRMQELVLPNLSATTSSAYCVNPSAFPPPPYTLGRVPVQTVGQSYHPSATTSSAYWSDVNPPAYVPPPWNTLGPDTVQAVGQSYHPSATTSSAYWPDVYPPAYVPPPWYTQGPDTVQNLGQSYYPSEYTSSASRRRRNRPTAAPTHRYNLRPRRNRRAQQASHSGSTAPASNQEMTQPTYAFPPTATQQPSHSGSTAPASNHEMTQPTYAFPPTSTQQPSHSAGSTAPASSEEMRPPTSAFPPRRWWETDTQQPSHSGSTASASSHNMRPPASAVPPTATQQPSHSGSTASASSHNMRPPASAVPPTATQQPSHSGSTASASSHEMRPPASAVPPTATQQPSHSAGSTAPASSEEMRPLTSAFPPRRWWETDTQQPSHSGSTASASSHEMRPPASAVPPTATQQPSHSETTAAGSNHVHQLLHVLQQIAFHPLIRILNVIFRATELSYSAACNDITPPLYEELLRPWNPVGPHQAQNVGQSYHPSASTSSTSRVGMNQTTAPPSTNTFGSHPNLEEGQSSQFGPTSSPLTHGMNAPPPPTSLPPRREPHPLQCSSMEVEEPSDSGSTTSSATRSPEDVRSRSAPPPFSRPPRPVLKTGQARSILEPAAWIKWYLPPGCPNDEAFISRYEVHEREIGETTNGDWRKVDDMAATLTPISTILERRNFRGRLDVIVRAIDYHGVAGEFSLPGSIYLPNVATSSNICDSATPLFTLPRLEVGKMIRPGSLAILLKFYFTPRNESAESLIRKYEIYTAKIKGIYEGGDADICNWMHVDYMEPMPLPIIGVTTGAFRGYTYFFKVRAIYEDNLPGAFSNICQIYVPHGEDR